MTKAAADPLAAYNAKRDFGKTREPKGELAAEPGHLFMVQKHDATRLHWDLRLEKDGVLKSWAVTRGPSLDPADKRLAVRTEDHPLSYATFEGTIPKKEYGGGTVMLWDRGTWAPIAGKTADTLEDGHLHFTLEGERMKGEWLLVRIKGKPGEKRENWLLRKIDDDHAGGSDDLVAHALTSVATGRTMDEIARGVAVKGARPGGKTPSAGPVGSSDVERDSPAGAGVSRPRSKPTGKGQGKAKKASLKAPAFQPPQLATLVDAVPAGSGWMHEVKYDGYRALTAVGGGTATVYTRSGLDWTDRFTGIADAAAALPGAALIDGEIVKLDADGRPSFSALQSVLKDGGDGLILFAFDLLEQDGEDLRRLPNVARKERLRALIADLDPDGPVQLAEHVLGEGEALFETMCREGYEGIVAKRADAPYANRRSQAWLKVKCTRRQEFLIVGWTKSSARGRPFSSLLLGLRDDDGALRYAGKVGTGFDTALLADLARRMKPLARKTPPVEVPRAAARGASWIRPELVAEVAYAEFTAENVVRHASFVGLREDKPAREVRAEKAAPAPKPKAPAIKVSNPDRVIFPDSGITKGELAAYYAEIAPAMLPDSADRPISLVRCPQGRAKHCFFQKHDAGSFGDKVGQVDIREKDGSTEAYLFVDGTDGLVACVQMGTIEFHGWGSRVADVEKPDRMVFDLDPDEGLGFDEVKRAAADLRDHLADIGLSSFPLLSGGKGVHVVVPLSPAAEWPAVKDFAQRFSIALATAEPDRFVATMSKAKRKGRIFIDWLRNQRGATAIMPFSARARPGAPVAAPVTWDELKGLEGANRWSVRDAAELLERAAAPALRGWGRADQVLPDL
ncbi:bifunctional non-homologous end joining protein LigD [Sphingomonas jejuensis]|uniref:DNA ligase (ATP) n=1 Tax=Sphingomonas jejuensis TaxID=904715 RepID=A0ABX0XPD7_9SPHN|nr:DNA ligase D [Sphingomonas jejuensis]NJC35119.1 bifunctional non-homologous end joining protein LigD [Sphingomonas jejuensis]